jgi:hypothetical protein
MAAVTGAQGDGDVDNVGYPGGRAPGAYPQRQPLIERDDPGHRGSQQAREAGLGRAASPGLSEDSGRDGQFGPAGEGLTDQDGHPAVPRLQRDQGAGVEGDAGHSGSPSARRAQVRSASVGGPDSA